HGGVDWSPRGDLLASVAARHDTRDDDLVTDVWVVAPDGSGLRALTDSTLSIADGARFSADGSRICFIALEVGHGARTVGIRNAVPWAVPVDGTAAPRPLLDRERYHLTGPGGEIVAAPDGLLFPNENRGAVELLLVPYEGGEPRVLLDGARQAVAAAAAADVV